MHEISCKNYVRGKKVHSLAQPALVEIHILVISHCSPPKYSVELMAATTISEETCTCSKEQNNFKQKIAG